MINNEFQITGLFNFQSLDDCYFLQILKRRKDNLEMQKDMECIDNIFIYSLDDWNKKLPRIINTCNLHNARAYIRVNKRSIKDIALHTNQKIADFLITGQYIAVKNAYLSIAGQINNELLKRWIVDIDFPPTIGEKIRNDQISRIRYIIEEFHKETNKKLSSADKEHKILTQLPTKNGVHLITHAFHEKQFREIWTAPIDIHRDNPTILYIP